MMNEKANDKDVREIPKWARRYAVNRAVPVIVYMCLSLLMSGVIGGLSLLTAGAYKNGARGLVAVGGLGLCASLVFLVWLSFVGCSRLMEKISRRAYRGEGEASVGPKQENIVRKPTLGVCLFMFCVLASTVLGLLGFLHIRHMQPISALYCVPFLVYLWHCMGRLSPFQLLWPALYALHAILLVAGAPIYFEGSLQPLNILIPIAGYGLVLGLAAHVYSRYALRRLRRLAATPEGQGEGERSEDE